MKRKRFSAILLLMAVSIVSWAGTLRWSAEWVDDDSELFDKVIIGRVADGSTNPLNNDGIYIGYADSQVSFIGLFPELDEYQSSDASIPDLENFPNYYYFMELYAGDKLVAYTDLTPQYRLTFGLVENGAHEPWDVNTFHSAAVPEPSSGLLLLLGGALLGLRRKRKQVA